MRALRFAIAAVSAVVVAAASLGLAASPAAAQTSGGCGGLTADGTACVLADVIPPEPGAGALFVNDGLGGPFYSWYQTAIACNTEVVSAFWQPIEGVAGSFEALATGLEGAWALAVGALIDTEIDGDELDALLAAIEGRIWFAELMQPDGTPTGTGLYGCAGVEAALPEPPRPPSPAEVWAAALTFEPDVHLDPAVRGLTGLETYVWYEGPTTASIDPPLILRGYSLAADIAAYDFTWDLGAPDRTGNQTITSPHPGDAGDPAGGHTYAEPADATVTHRVYWTGTYTIAGPGFPPGGLTYDLGTAAVVVAVDYQVIEIRTPVLGGR